MSLRCKGCAASHHGTQIANFSIVPTFIFNGNNREKDEVVIRYRSRVLN